MVTLNGNVNVTYIYILYKEHRSNALSLVDFL